jgi:hypothetical protein
MAIITRQTDHPGVTNRNRPLTNAELDNNFIELFDLSEESTSDNTPDTVVKRDEDGGFKAGIIESFYSRIKNRWNRNHVGFS